MSRILAIAQLGHAVLREACEAIADFSGAEIRTLFDDMLATVTDANGVGIAAPQVYQPVQAMIVWSRPNPRYPYAPVMEPLAICNPKILSISDEMIKDWEGCLSVPGVRALVPRHKAITVEFAGRDGRIVQAEYTDFLARVFQHEHDHLHGRIFLDRVESSKEIVMEKEWLRIIAARNAVQ